MVGEWDDLRDPSAFFKSSDEKIQWRCAFGHPWKASISHRVTGRTGCPTCSGGRTDAAMNSIHVLRPGLAAQWHPTKNGALTPENVKPTSARSVWWRHPDCGHEWEGQVRYRSTDRCLVCEGGVALPGINDVVTLDPGIEAFWDRDLAPQVDLHTLRPNSLKRVHWKCPSGHTWVSSVQAFRALTGARCPYCNGRRVLRGFNDVATTHRHLVADLDPDAQDPDILSKISAGSGRRVGWRCRSGHRWTTRIVDRVHYKTGCPECAAESWSSNAEDELAAWVEGLLGEPVRRAVFLRSGSVRGNFDICVESQRVIIEYNGLYFHSEAVGRDRGYHSMKQVLAEDNGYTLITVWEDDWLHRRPIVEAFLAHRLARSAQARTAARTASIEDIGRSEATEFLSRTHLQGAVLGSVMLGLRHPEHGLVALLVARIEGHTATISRYSTSVVVAGGFSRLLVALERRLAVDHPTVTHVKTYSDNAISDGTLYAATGFTYDGPIRPDYTYLRPGINERQHKFNYRLKRFKADPDLTYVDGATERELAALNGLHRVWDFGKRRWVKQVAG